MQRHIICGFVLCFASTASFDKPKANEPPDNIAGTAIRRYAAAGALWLWPAGSTIEGCFANGVGDERKLVVDGADAWMRHANIRFDFGPAPTYRNCPLTAPFPPTRVTFGSGNVSHARLGTYALDRPSEKPTMFIATTNATKKPIPVENLRATILHEFGHILGLKHEHQHPESACFHMVAWTQLCAKREQSARLPSFIVTNWLPMIGRVNPDYAVGAPYDPLSIMHYKFNAKNFTGPATTCAGPRNFSLSDGDTTRVTRLYPKSPDEQRLLIQSQAPLIARAILETGDLDQAAAERIAREGERIVRRAFVDLNAFRIDVASGMTQLKPGRSDRGSTSLTSFGAGAAEAAAAACAQAEAPLPPGAALQIRRGDH